MALALINRVNKRIDDIYHMRVAPEYVDIAIEKLVDDVRVLRNEVAELRALVAALHQTQVAKPVTDPVT